MTLTRLAWQVLWVRPLATLLSLALMALGVAAMVVLLLVAEQTEATIERDLAGIDLVVGAKGSPLQLILAGVFHLDVPPGNISLAEAQQLAQHPMVAQAVPISLGDSLRGFRIVGTTPDFLGLYQGQLAQGRMWRNGPEHTMQAVLGATVAATSGYKLGDKFIGSHGLGGEGEAHANSPYTVVGLLKPTGTVLDRLVLVSTESVWQVHEQETTTGDADDRKAVAEALAEDREITMLLLRYRTPLAVATLPRAINMGTAMQAASPAAEASRLLNLVGVGMDVLRAFGGVLLASAALSVFVALLQAVQERRGHLAMLRLLGAPPGRVAALVVVQALWLAGLGAALGLALGHALTGLIGYELASQRSLAITGWWWSATEAVWLLGLLGLALLAAVVPAWMAYRVDVMKQLNAGA
jgi:putative ABC transport system permease protein